MARRIKVRGVGPAEVVGVAWAQAGEAEVVPRAGLMAAVVARMEGPAAPAAVVRSVGQHPETGTEIQIKDGRYGPYITDGKVNVSLKKSEDPEAIGLDEAVQRLTEKAAKGPTKRRYPRRKKKA